ncbi:MAG: hypothetical protein M3133_09835 [Actinomycetota bacterium]|nr:hypothetical protein [Actinomycetota bacterium]
MTVFAISGGMAVLSWIGLLVGVVVLVVVVALLNRVMIPAREISRYADDILEGGVAIARNVDGVDELHRTRELGAGVPDLANAYLDRLRNGQRSTAQTGQWESAPS